MDKMKFDVVIGNPPYQDDTKQQGANGRKQASSKLWPKFMKMAFDVGDVVSLIVPSGCLKGTKLCGENFVERIKNGQICEIVTSETSWFPGTSTKNLFFVSSKEKVQKVSITDITNPEQPTEKEYLVDDFSAFIPHRNTTVAAGIVKKVLSYNKPMFKDGVGGYTGIGSLPLFNTQKDGWVLYAGGGTGTKDPIFKWSKTCPKDLAKRYHGQPKVIVPIGCGDKPHFYYDEIGNTTVATSANVLKIDDTVTFEGFKTYFLSKIIRYLVSYQRFDGYGNHALNHIPLIDLQKQWTDAELYSLFNLTDDEITHIEESIK